MSGRQTGNWTCRAILLISLRHTTAKLCSVYARYTTEHLGQTQLVSRSSPSFAPTSLAMRSFSKAFSRKMVWRLCSGSSARLCISSGSLSDRTTARRSPESGLHDILVPVHQTSGTRRQNLYRTTGIGARTLAHNNPVPLRRCRRRKVRWQEGARRAR